MKLLSIIARWVFVVCMPLFLLSASIAAAVNSLRLYEYGFNKYHISQVTGITYPELVKGARGLISYFNAPGEEYINVVVEKDGQPFTLFNEREIIHLKDVKALFQLDYKIMLITLIYILAYAGACFYLAFKQKKDGMVSSWRKSRYLRTLAWNKIFGSGLTLAVMLVLWIVSLVDFEGFFIQFHLIAFSNDFWELNPYTDYLLMMFPEGFWNDTVIFIALGAALAAIILAAAAIGHLVFNKTEKSA